MHIHALSNVKFTPLAKFGLVHSFWTIHLDALIYTWASMFCLAVFIYFSRRALEHPKGAVVFLVERVVAFFDDTLLEGFGYRNSDAVGFVVGLFFFTLFCNICGLLPFIKEATVNINTTLAIALLSFVYVQYQSIRTRKFGYVLKFLQPIFIFAPLNIISSFAKIASLNFRLFGNIMGGAIIWDLLYQMLAKIHLIFAFLGLVVLPICLWLVHHKLAPRLYFLQQIAYASMRIIQLVPAALIVFGVFEGALHAFVISLLTSIYINGEVDTSGVGH
jgi:F-type H+-transporting ATPase subunit a